MEIPLPIGCRTYGSNMWNGVSVFREEKGLSEKKVVVRREIKIPQSILSLEEKPTQVRDFQYTLYKELIKDWFALYGGGLC